MHHVHDPASGPIGELGAFPVRRGNRGASGQRHAERLGERVHRERGAHGVAVSGAGHRRGHHFKETLLIDVALGEQPARFPHCHAGARQLPLIVAVEHRTAGEHDRWDVHRRRGHQAGGRGLVATGGQHDAVKGIAVQDLDQAQVGEIAVERRRRPPAAFLNRMHGKDEGNAARFANPVADAIGEKEVMAVASRQVAPRLRDADDRLAALHLLARDPVVGEALEIDGGGGEIVGIVEPGAASQAAGAFFAGSFGLRHE